MRFGDLSRHRKQRGVARGIYLGICSMVISLSVFPTSNCWRNCKCFQIILQFHSCQVLVNFNVIILFYNFSPLQPRQCYWLEKLLLVTMYLHCIGVKISIWLQ